LQQDFGAVGIFRVDVVVDMGAGIAPENQDKDFGEFIQFSRNEWQAGGFCCYLQCIEVLPLSDVG